MVVDVRTTHTMHADALSCSMCKSACNTKKTEDKKMLVFAAIVMGLTISTVVLMAKDEGTVTA